MVDLNLDMNDINAQLLLQGIWYLELPDLMDLDELIADLSTIFSHINSKNLTEYAQSDEGFITDWRFITPPPYIRSPGVEAISFFDFKKNKSLREMQIPNLLHYISFMYNTLFEFNSIFGKLYLDESNYELTKNSLSYLVYGEEFVLHDYNQEDDYDMLGKFTAKNNKIHNSTIMAENKKRYLQEEADYIFSLKMDIESFFPNLYTHNFEKMAQLPPYVTLNADIRYFKFLDLFHQRVNNNQTKGIPAGIFSSHIAAELCMLSVDYEITGYIRSTGRRIGYVRYVDDLTFFSDAESELSELFPSIQSILNKYRLRINGNKTESLRSVYLVQPTYITEIENVLPFLRESSDAVVFGLTELFDLKKYVVGLLLSKHTSQIRTVLSIFLKKIREEKLDITNVIEEVFYYLLKLVFEDESLACHIYRLIDIILLKADNIDNLVKALALKRNKIDNEYPDTILQIWYYHILMRHSNSHDKGRIINDLGGKLYNPLVLTTMVEFGEKRNRKLFTYIRDTYINESGSNEWKKEIIYSKWWLPLFRILRYDTYNYDGFMKSKNIPQVFKLFSMHSQNGCDYSGTVLTGQMALAAVLPQMPVFLNFGLPEDA